MKQNKLPEWFNGTVYDQGDSVINPFSGESYELNNLELSMYDFVMGAQMTFAVHQEKQPNKPISEKLIKDFESGLTWFRKTNPKAYMALLD
mgnify:CR=1 FL=1|tara:strand:+ start:1170 stop:1442 length:273 start_codon:yes stop_codon:yes gene_type:complete